MRPFTAYWIKIMEVLPIDGFRNGAWYVGWMTAVLQNNQIRIQFLLPRGGTQEGGVYQADISRGDPFVVISEPREVAKGVAGW